MSLTLKFGETSFDEYTTSVEKQNIHEDISIDLFPENVRDLENIIIYGSCGSGKYSQALYHLRKYSMSSLKYEKKITLSIDSDKEKNKQSFKISDIHYEIDMSLLGCYSKNIWHEFYLNVIDIINTKQHKTGIILCKHFQEIHNELLENFYSYMQTSYENIRLIFVIITEQLSFIPENIINRCSVLSIAKPSVSRGNNLKLSKIARKDLPTDFSQNIADKIYAKITNIDTIDYLKFRDILYLSCTYNLNIFDMFFVIFDKLLYHPKISRKILQNIIRELFEFFKKYNNKYRPISHLEYITLYIANALK